MARRIDSQRRRLTLAVGALAACTAPRPSRAAERVVEDDAGRKVALPTVRARRVLLAPRLPFGWFDAPPALNRFAGLIWLSAILHPGRARRPLDETLLDLFEWLYHHRPSNADMRDLLATARMRDR